MAKATKQPRRKTRKTQQAVAPAELPQRMNYIIMLSGVAVIIFGYILMSMGDATSALSVTIAPIILIIGYCIVIPFGILYRPKPQDESASQS
ncbi:MAG: hypothetical protein CL946_04995 [Ectothiorhodospiraceae bacterium]|nr:hypothetical protein [Ectothiorhodospiraceae bacterium]